MNKDVLDGLKQYCPKGYVTRKEVKKLTGGLVSGRTIAILDQKGKGVQNRQLIGCKIIYPIEDLIEWLKNNAEFENFNSEAENE